MDDEAQASDSINFTRTPVVPHVKESTLPDDNLTSNEVLSFEEDIDRLLRHSEKWSSEPVRKRNTSKIVYTYKVPSHFASCILAIFLRYPALHRSVLI